jgi:XTP/dITP diphosphohydrolase
LSLSIVLATRNAGKIGEIRAILSNLDVVLLDSGDFPPFPEPSEEGATFFENAFAKAKAVHKATGLPALADDSGIEVDALDGAPGVRSARYGGAGLADSDRCARLLEALKGVPEGKRGARFCCVAVLYPAPRSKRKGIVTEGFLYGEIAEEPRGQNGFGYDPIFLVPERGKTVAQMNVEEKNSLSHRFRALLEMKFVLEREYNVNFKKSGEEPGGLME